MAPGQKRPGTAGSTGLTQPQLQELRETFNVLDHDGDGAISETDLKLAIAQIGG